MPEDRAVPIVTVAAEPDALVRFATTTSPASARLLAQSHEVRTALGHARPGPWGHLGAGLLGEHLADHARRAADHAGSTSAVGIPLLRPLREMDDDEVAAFVASSLGLPPRAGPGVVASTVDPDDVAVIAALLTPGQLARLAADQPHLVGPVDGMPFGARYAANRVLVARAADAADRLGDAERAGHLRSLLAPARQILFVDPSGDGRVAEALGDLDTAGAIAVVVPGMGNSLANFERGTATKGEALFAAAGEGTAVIAWLGYDSPTADVLLDDAALEGAEHLVRVLDAMPDHARRTVVGHSYGTVVTAAALQRGLEVDQVVVTGSPGMLAATADDLAGPIPIWAARAPLDYVGWSESYGRDPSDPRFGATRFDTGDEVVGHSGYFDPGTESLANIARIVGGELDEVTVVEPGLTEQVIGVLDDVHASAGGVVDGVQERAEDAAGIVSWAVDHLQPVLPEDVEPFVDGVQHGVGDVLELTDRATDLVQRLSSPDLVGDVALDSWEHLHDHAGDLAGGLVDLLPG
jgi:hypothetical protein